MKLTLMNPGTGNSSIVEVGPDDPIENIKALVEIDMGIPFAEQVLIHNNKMLVDGKNFDFYGIKNEDLIVVQRKITFNPTQLSQLLSGMVRPAAPVYDPLTDPLFIKEAQETRAYYENNPAQLNLILHKNPAFAEAVLKEDMSDLIKYLYNEWKAKKLKEAQELKRIAALNADPMNPENQRIIEEEIRMKNVDENLEYAQEFIPEVFAPVTMLYVDIMINKHPIQAFVDSGAQNTIMSKGCAERCGIMRLVDKRYAGTAVGVGTAKILGRIHAIDMMISNRVISCSLTILEDDKVEFLFGLDNLKRHECCIDLKKKVLSFSDFSVPFLSDKEIKRTLVQAHEEMEKGSQSKGSEIKGSQIKDSQIKETGYPESVINNLIGLGFTRNFVIRALDLCNGNAEMAASLLFTNSSMLN